VRNRVSILVVGNLAVRTALRAILESDGRLEVIDEADDGDQAVASYRERPARVVVICHRSDGGSPVEDDVVDTARRIRDEASDARIIVVADRPGRNREHAVDGALTRAVNTEAARCLPGVAVELGRR
jgi:DNA-binding NarL/FixJ family response regulator